MQGRFISKRTNRYQSSIQLIDDEYGFKAPTQDTSNIDKVFLAKTTAYDTSVGREEWIVSMEALRTLDFDTYNEVISDMCSSYLQTKVDSLRMVCEWIATSNQFDFLNRCKCIDTLSNPSLTLSVCKQYMNDPTDDMNYTMYSEYVAKLYSFNVCTPQDAEKLTSFVFTAKFVPWNTKYSLWKHCSSSNLPASSKQICGKQLLQHNPLSSFTVLSMQLFAFDMLTLQTILKRVKVFNDDKVKADVLDHLLSYPSTNKAASLMLKDLGEGMKTLDSSQNVHMVSADIDTWIQSIARIPSHNISFDQVEKDLLERFGSDVATSLRRIGMDNSVYGKLYYKLSVILLKVYNKIVGHPHETELFQRLHEELMEMSETCSTGHLLRLMNVFSGYEQSFIQIDPTVEMKSVCNKRLQSLLESLHDVYEDDLLIVEGRRKMLIKPKEEHLVSIGADTTNKQSIYDIVLDAWAEQNEPVLQQYLYSYFPTLRDELYKDYVGQKLMTEDVFDETYREVIKSLFV